MYRSAIGRKQSKWIHGKNRVSHAINITDDVSLSRQYSRAKYAEVLGAKISESEFASELVYRTLSSTRKANLNAPPLDGRGIGGDPNSVAEYLDNTLDETRIPGFEKVCLESDMFLSEVACCHNILSICIDQPITVENELRDRVLSMVEASLAKTQELAETESQPKSVSRT